MENVKKPALVLRPGFQKARTTGCGPLSHFKMKKIKYLTILFGSLLLFANLAFQTSTSPLPATLPVQELLMKLGAEPAPHLPNKEVKGVSVERGRDIVLKGYTDHPDGGRSRRVSRHFVCTACHNVERDEPDLTKTDPMNRLQYVAGKGLPFLQGSALYGIVDRRHFYNGDYKKKYGQLVEPARNDLRQAIQLCATECSQGRPLEEWEMESVLSYLWTIGLKTGDLALSAGEQTQIENALNGRGDKIAARQLVESKYLRGAPATFLNPPADRQLGYSRYGDPETGRLIYELSCLHCHQNKRYSFFDLDASNLSFEFLAKHIPTYSHYSIYQVVRYGTSPLPGKKAYMPNYTKEKMSEQMLEDLRVYIEQQVK
ncbi:MAG TPA: cytochrome c [Bacteroidetes bacterium]|nr:cytochrome c [Bacteroidota bacterium]